MGHAQEDMQQDQQCVTSGQLVTMCLVAARPPGAGCEDAWLPHCPKVSFSCPWRCLIANTVYVVIRLLSFCFVSLNLQEFIASWWYYAGLVLLITIFSLETNVLPLYVFLKLKKKTHTFLLFVSVPPPSPPIMPGALFFPPSLKPFHFYRLSLLN